ncbi:hypothetical protein Daesc_004847 [Daldinia eschscholtzii]|uniref:Uncharacterized protein n=1 Tax=Daldinia eschscholtzii TaxID=292717 RepID=A0AAX6MQG7_9PEZI
MNGTKKELRAAEYRYMEEVKCVKRFGDLVPETVWLDYKDAFERLISVQKKMRDKIDKNIRAGNIIRYNATPPFEVCGSPGVDDDEGIPSPFFRNFEPLEPVVPTPLVQRPRHGHENHRHEPYPLPQSRSQTAVPSNSATSESGTLGKQSLASTSAGELSSRTQETPDELGSRIQEIMQVIIDNMDKPSRHTWELLTDIFDSSRRT